ncbi:hypothetical protein [Porticoccus sp.]|uniref:hypothetical protein n=1 Tax=Porticoccus sp. TaxID=2024853 RepID=UPI0025FEC83B|nr:hypothetical protein [Porticoccus sp.]|tara:strand:+ start:819 stop:1625 length:807 start_codon:yes stop_codon:yes gene_type:complete
MESPPMDWVQGHFFNFSCLASRDKEIIRSRVDGGVKENAICVLITQDCDICAHPNIEPDVQFVIGEKDRNPSPLNENCRSSRYLIFDIEGVPYKLKILKTVYLKKELFFQNQEAISDRNRLAEYQLNQLRRWLAQRYNRTALPDAFNSKLKDVVNNLPNEKVDIYIRLNSLDEDLENYQVALVAIPYQGAMLSPEDLQQLGEKMQLLAQKVDEQDGLSFDWEWLDENYCTLAMSRSEVTLDMLDHFMRWHLDFISFKENDYECGQTEG